RVRATNRAGGVRSAERVSLLTAQDRSTTGDRVDRAEAIGMEEGRRAAGSGRGAGDLADGSSVAGQGEDGGPDAVLDPPLLWPGKGHPWGRAGGFDDSCSLGVVLRGSRRTAAARDLIGQIEVGVGEA